MMNTESADQWGMTRPAPPPKRQGVCINFTPAETLALSMGNKSDWIKAGEYRFRYGRFAGKTVHEVANIDLQYLDFLLGKREDGGPDALLYALTEYLKDARVQMALTLIRRK